MATRRGLAESIPAANTNDQPLHDSFQSSRGEPLWPSGFVQFILCVVPSAPLRESSVHSRTTHKILSNLGKNVLPQCRYFREYATLLVLLSASFTQIAYILDNTLCGMVSGAPKEPSVPLPDIPEGGNAEALTFILAGQQHSLPAREFRPVARVLLPLHGGKTRP
jgi:hypothetical protein